MTWFVTRPSYFASEYGICYLKYNKRSKQRRTDMRLHLTLAPNREPVPFNYQHQLTGTLHKWLGENELHKAGKVYSS